MLWDPFQKACNDCTAGDICPVCIFFFFLSFFFESLVRRSLFSHPSLLDYLCETWAHCCFIFGHWCFIFGHCTVRSSAQSGTLLVC